MSKLKLFKSIGESYARTVAFDIIGEDSVAKVFFADLAEDMYPENKHRREWAFANIQLFYDEERARIRVFKKLSDAPMTNFLDSVRKDRTVEGDK